MKLNKFPTTKIETKQKWLIAIALVILRHTMRNSFPVTGFSLYPLKTSKNYEGIKSETSGMEKTDEKYYLNRKAASLITFSLYTSFYKEGF